MTQKFLKKIQFQRKSNVTLTFMELQKRGLGLRILADNYLFQKEAILKNGLKKMDLILNNIIQYIVKQKFIFIHYPMTYVEFNMKPDFRINGSQYCHSIF